MDELSKVSYAIKMNPRIAIGESLFSLVYGIKVVIPSKVQESILYSIITREENDGYRKNDLFLIDEKRENALIRLESQKRTIPKCYNKFDKSKNFSVEDWVLHKALDNKVQTNFEKFVATWEDPYVIYHITPKGSYRREREKVLVGTMNKCRCTTFE